MSPQDFIYHFIAAAEFLASHKDEINKLNVFPVPDGDTGTNMSLTIMSVIKELEALPANTNLGEVRKAVTHGSLMGARGNSGVITSQILRGFCEGLEGASFFDAKTLAIALEKSVEVAFAAVRRPVEGTILTVIKDMSLAARRSADAELDSNSVLRALVDEAFASVQRTPDLLPILKENNVVDAGGYGLALLVQGFVESVTGDLAGDLLTGLGSVDSASPDILQGPLVAIEQIDDWDDSEYLYCTEFLLTSNDLDIEAALEFLASMGDCELLVGSHPDFKIHLHSDEPGQVLNYMITRGQVRDVHIHNMRMQSEARSTALAAEASLTAEASLAAGVSLAAGAPQTINTSPDSTGGFAVISSTPKQRGYIAVASGTGMQRILESLGVDVIVSGGQTMNPSTAELLEAIDAVNADEVIIFPNNKNIIMAAQAAADVSVKQVIVVPTKSVPESFSALFVANAKQSLTVEAAEMVEAAAEVRAAEITHAVKDAVSAHGEEIHAGNVIGIANDAIEVVGVDVDSVALKLVKHIADDDCDTLTLLAGEQLDQQSFEQIVSLIEESYPDLEIDARRGDQPLYPLVMAAE
ncbi:MAG: DAK2 domain-containing protein [Coriobacteriales bacterium]|jgi:DAK2 domain fusion protein YloV|nr:DAK2 domain-containing protein [Coriobacteriales bacterium]